MDTIDTKMFARFLIKRMRECNHELNAHRAVLENFKLLLPGKPEEWLELYRNAPEIQALTEKQFAGLDELVERLGEDLQAKALLELLEKWKPDGEPN
ncbi:MAG: hypothetical protein ACLPND_11730 [Candidatus Korobacteraceae bacterium]